MIYARFYKNLTTRCFHIKLRIWTQMPLWKFHNKQRISWPCLHSNLMHLTLSFSTYEYKFFCGTHLLELMTSNHTSDAHFQPSYGRIRWGVSDRICRLLHRSEFIFFRDFAPLHDLAFWKNNIGWSHKPLNRGTFATNWISAGNTNWTNTNNFHTNFPSLRLSQRLFFKYFNSFLAHFLHH